MPPPSTAYAGDSMITSVTDVGKLSLLACYLVVFGATMWIGMSFYWWRASIPVVGDPPVLAWLSGTGIGAVLGLAQLVWIRAQPAPAKALRITLGAIIAGILFLLMIRP